MNTSPFPCKTPGCPGERLYHKGSNAWAHEPTLYKYKDEEGGGYFTSDYCPSCNLNPFDGVAVATEMNRLAELAGQASLEKNAAKTTLKATKRRSSNDRQFQRKDTADTDLAGLFA